MICERDIFFRSYSHPDGFGVSHVSFRACFSYTLSSMHFRYVFICHCSETTDRGSALRVSIRYPCESRVMFGDSNAITPKICASLCIVWKSYNVFAFVSFYNFPSLLVAHYSFVHNIIVCISLFSFHSLYFELLRSIARSKLKFCEWQPFYSPLSFKNAFKQASLLLPIKLCYSRIPPFLVLGSTPFSVKCFRLLY